MSHTILGLPERDVDPEKYLPTVCDDVRDNQSTISSLATQLTPYVTLITEKLPKIAETLAGSHPDLTDPQAEEITRRMVRVTLYQDSIESDLGQVGQDIEAICDILGLAHDFKNIL